MVAILSRGWWVKDDGYSFKWECHLMVQCWHVGFFQNVHNRQMLAQPWPRGWDMVVYFVSPKSILQWYHTVYPKKYAHGFVVLYFVVVMPSFIMNSHEVFIHIHQGCFAGTGAIVRLPQCQWSKPDGYGKISQCITTTKHSKAKTVCIFLGIYCNEHDDVSNHQQLDWLPKPFVQAQIKENIKAPRHWPLWGESTGHRWIPLTKGMSFMLYLRHHCSHVWYWIIFGSGLYLAL